MLQLLLSQHPSIASLPEPWFMLHLLYALRSGGLATEYNARSAYRGLSEFIAALPNGHESFIAAVRSASMTLYEAALKSLGKELFLDKTPRYYLVVPELREAFPRATFLFLVRNPLDVLSSMLETQATTWTDLARRDLLHDLVTGPPAIHQASSSVGGKKILIRYEDVVANPRHHLEEICRTIGLPFNQKMLRYRNIGAPGRSLGDWTGVHKHEIPVSDYIGVWHQRLDTRWKRELALAYLRHLGPGTVRGLGYDYGALESELSGMGFISRRGNRRWRIIATPRSERRWWDTAALSTARAVRQRGRIRTLLHIAYIAWHGRPRRRPPQSPVTD